MHMNMYVYIVIQSVASLWPSTFRAGTGAANYLMITSGFMIMITGYCVN
jgi:hypothetical protein